MNSKKRKKAQVKDFFKENYNRFSIHDIYAFAMKRQEYEDRYPEQVIKTKCKIVDD